MVEVPAWCMGPIGLVVVCLGVMLYLMVAGVYPFEDPDKPDNVACTLQNVRDGRIRPLPAGVSHACADLIAKMLHKKAAKRVTLVSPSLLPFLPFLPFLPIVTPLGGGVGGGLPLPAKVLSHRPPAPHRKITTPPEIVKSDKIPPNISLNSSRVILL